MQLELVPTDELLNELMNRFDTVVFAAYRDMTKTEFGRVMHWRAADMAAGIGLLELLKHRMINCIESTCREADSL